MNIILIGATIIGGCAAIWYFIEKIFSHPKDIIKLTEAGGTLFQENSEEIYVNKKDVKKILESPNSEVGKTKIILKNDKTLNVIESPKKVRKNYSKMGSGAPPVGRSLNSMLKTSSSVMVSFFTSSSSFFMNGWCVTSSA